MKKVLSFIIIFLLFMTVEAKTLYNNTPSFSNDYIKGFSNYQRYFVTKSTKYGFSSGAAVNNSKFKTGGLLNNEEFNVIGGRSSYLFNGLTFFTMTESGGNVTVIDPTASSGTNSLSAGSAVSGVRVTNYVKSGINVEGYGTRVSPWKVSQKFNVTFKYDDTKITVKPTSVTVTKGGYVIVDVIPTEQYTYKSQTTCGEIEDGKLRISGITKDIVCEIEYTLRDYKVTIDAGKSKYNVEGVFDNSIGGQGWSLIESNKKATQDVSYQDKIKNIPSASQVYLKGYTLSGWSENNAAIDPSKYKVTKNSNISATFTQNKYTVTYVPHRGTISQTTKEVTYDENYGYNGGLSTPTAPKGYTFIGWHLGSETGKLITEDTRVETDSNHELHATWNPNPYTVTVNANGGKITTANGWTLGSENTTATNTVVFDSAYGALPTPTWSGHTFEGWHLGSENGDAITSTTVVYTDSNHTLVAKWYTNVTIPTASKYCLNPTYDDTKHVIVSDPPEGFTWSNHEQTNAGTYIVTAKINTGYTWGGTDFEDKTIECSIKQRNITVVARNQSKTYDGKALEDDKTCDATSGLISGHTVSCTSTGSQTDAGSSTKTLSTVVIKKGTKDVSNNYAITKGDGVLLVNQKAITITANAQTVAYGTTISKTVNDVTVATLVSGHSITAITLKQSTSDLTSDGTITPSAAIINSGSTDVTSNYSITYKTGKLIVNQKAITITANAQTITYGSSISNTVSDVTAATLASGHSVTAITLTGSTTNVTTDGTITPSAATIKSGSTDVTSNYNITYKTGKLTINKKSATITANAQTITYGGSISTSTSNVTSSGLLSGHSVTAITLTGSTTNATNNGTITPSAATIKSGSNNVTSNYSITYKTGKLTINKKSLSIPSSPSDKTYSGSSQNSGITCPSGSNASGTQSAINASSASYIQTCTLSSTTNYVWSDGTSDAKNIKWNIKPKSVSVSWGTTTSFTYNGNPQAPSASASTGVSGETMSVSNTSNTNAGSNYTSKASCGSVSGGQGKCGNYSLTNTEKAYSISKAKTATPGSCLNPEYTGRAQTLASGGDYVTYSPSTGTAVGNYSVTVTPDSNHLFSDGTSSKTLSSCKIIEKTAKCWRCHENGDEPDFYKWSVDMPTNLGTGCSATSLSESACSRIDCFDGKYSNKDGRSCATCPSPYNKSNHNSTSISDCMIILSEGQYIAYPTATSVSTCEAGYYSEALTVVYYGSSNSCTKCPKGYACSGGKKSACVASDATTTGTYTNAEGKISCTSALGGYYTSKAAADSAFPCPKGYACPSGKKIACTASTNTSAGGYTDSTGLGSCKTPGTGYYAASTAAEKQTTCIADHYCTGGKIIPCPDGKHSGNGVSSSSSCHYYCNVSNCSSCGSDNCCSSCNSGWHKSGCSCEKDSSSGGSTGGGCFLAGTNVKTLLGDKAINDLFIGELVLTYNEELKVNEYKKIKDIFTFKNMKEILYTLTFDNGEKLSLTHLHRVYVDRNGIIDYIKAENILINDKVLFADGTYHNVANIAYKNIYTTVYNLELEGNNNFYVGDAGILVHNTFLSMQLPELHK